MGFSIDGFGHSSLTPYLFKALGHEAIVIYRMPHELYEGFNDDHQYFFTWEGDNQERIKVYRLAAYSLDERFNLAHNSGICFQQNYQCAEPFLEAHFNKLLFKKYPEGNADSDPLSPNHERIAF